MLTTKHALARVKRGAGHSDDGTDQSVASFLPKCRRRRQSCEPVLSIPGRYTRIFHDIGRMFHPNSVDITDRASKSVTSGALSASATPVDERTLSA